MTQSNLPATIEGLKEFILIGREKVKVHKAKLKAIEIIDKAHTAKDAATQDAIDITEVILYAESRLGELIKELPKPKFDKKINGSLRGTTGTLPPGVTKKLSHQAQQTNANEEAAEQLIEEAREKGKAIFPNDISREIRKKKSKERLDKEYRNFSWRKYGR
jgi:hypothetical protein